MNIRIISTKIASVIIVLGVLFFFQAAYEKTDLILMILKSLGVTFLTAGAFGRVWASAYITGLKNKKLITGGPYSLIRNPLYFFSMLSFIGAGLVFGSISIALIFAILFFITHWKAIITEEGRLRRIFGDEFTEYMKNVPRFFPRSFKIKHGDSLAIPSRSFMRAVIDCSLIMGTIIAAQILEWAHLTSLLPTYFQLP